VLSVLRRQFLIKKVLTEVQATTAVVRLGRWRLNHASIPPLVDAAWSHRHNMTAADALYIALAEHLGADFLTDDHKLAESPTFPRNLKVLRLPTTV